MVDVNIVIAHCNENLTWTKYLIYPFEVYSCHKIAEGHANNAAREANAYIKYIINNYNNLSEYTIFLHGHDTAWHQSEHIYETIKKLNFNRKYFNINVNNRPLNELECTPYIIRFINSKLLNNIIFNHLGLIFDYSKSKVYKSKHNAQFYVHKNLIQQYTLEQWKSLYNELYNFNLYKITSCNMGIVFECLWFFIFTHEYIDVLSENFISKNNSNDELQKN